MAKKAIIEDISQDKELMDAVQMPLLSAGRASASIIAPTREQRA